MFEDWDDSSEDEFEKGGFPSKETSKRNYEGAGLEVHVPENGPSLLGYQHLLNDKVHQALQLVLMS